ncbi:MAG: hypothetical protein N2C14_27240 [Planctomycetales bacterium]
MVLEYLSAYPAACFARVVVIERYGYPTTMTLDVGLGLVCLLVLPLATPRREKTDPEKLPPSAASLDA